MNTSIGNAQPAGQQLDQLHRDVAAFTEEMRQAQATATKRRPAMLSFALGAGAAITTFAAAAVLLHL